MRLAASIGTGMYRMAALAIFAGVTLAAGAGEPAVPAKIGINLSEPADRAAEVIRWPVTLGVPFAEGAIKNNTVFSLLDGAGKRLPLNALQTKVLGQWRTGQETPKWVLLDCQADIGNGSVPSLSLAPLSAVPEPEHPVGPSPLKVMETAKEITVDTGAVTFTVSKTNFSLLDSMSIDGGGQVLKGSSLYWVRDNGRRWEARTYGRPKVEVETQGPMKVVIKAEGWYAPEQGWLDRMMRYQVRITAFAGLPYVRIYHTLVWTADDNWTMKEFGLSFDAAQPATEARVGFAGEKTYAVPLGNVQAVQDKYQVGRLIVNGDTMSIKEVSGWAEIRNKNGGVAVAVKEMAHQIPKAFTATPERLTAHLWAPQAGVMSMKLEDRMAPASVKNNPDWAEWTSSNVQHVSPQGAAKTHEIWVWPTSLKGPSAEAVNDLVQRPVIAMADPVYQCSTGAIPYLGSRSLTPPRYRYIEEGLDAMVKFIARPHDSQNDYSMWNYGDVHLFGSSPWRSWDCGGYNWPAMPWLMFYRSGDRDYFMAGERNARHVMDVDVCHDGAEEGPADSVKVKGYAYTFSAWHWAWGPVFDNFISHPEYLEYYYYLTGYERAADVLRLMAHAAEWEGPTPNVKLDKDWISREHYGRIDSQTIYYDFTGNPIHRENALGWARTALEVRNPDGTFINNTFWGWVYTGLDRTYRVTGDGPIRDALVLLLKDFPNPPKDALTAPFWPGGQTLAPFAFAWQVTGNENYLHYPIERIKQQMLLTQLGGKPGFSAGPGFSSLDRNEFPQFIEGALDVLGAWATLGFKDVSEWPSNNAYFPSLPEKRENFLTHMTMYVRKDAGKAGTLLLSFKESNLRPYEEFKGKRIEARITGPDGKSRVIPIVGREDGYQGHMFFIGPKPVAVAFAAEEPAGEYRVEVVSEQQLFWICPKTDLPGLVVHVPEAKLGIMVYNDPCKYYFRLKPGAEKITVEQFGGDRGAKTSTVLDPGGVPLRLFGTDDGERMTVEVAGAQRDKMFSLLKGPVNYNMAGPKPQGVTIHDAYEYIGVNPYQWFLPAGAQSHSAEPAPKAE